MRKLIVVAYFVGIILLAWTAAGIREPHLASPTVVNVPAGGLVIPVVGVKASDLRDSFTAHRAGHDHRAIDILAPRGTPVLAAVDGSVRKLFVSRAGGITLYEYDLAGERSYYYAHLDGYASGIREGLAVHRGDVLGYVGTTGNAPANTPHLHFAISVRPSKDCGDRGYHSHERGESERRWEHQRRCTGSIHQIDYRARQHPGSDIEEQQHQEHGSHLTTAHVKERERNQRKDAKRKRLPVTQHERSEHQQQCVGQCRQSQQTLPGHRGR